LSDSDSNDVNVKAGEKSKKVLVKQFPTPRKRLGGKKKTIGSKDKSDDPSDSDEVIIIDYDVKTKKRWTEDEKQKLAEAWKVSAILITNGEPCRTVNGSNPKLFIIMA
jgi:hypothetical protein